MKPPSPKLLRCAVYTRKSTEHNLDLAFNSLDAQREACEAYIKSQAHEGWRLIPDAFDDGGLSGASLERAALQQLLAAIRARRVDVIVVYKVDRLTRSLADFAKLVELFDEHEVSFVSVTQSFNTTSSMGRLTLNVLLSFAQFEREVIGERVRDKIAASKRKGIWVGGPIPIGYRSVDKKLIVAPEQADVVRTIFSHYLALGSIGLLIEDLERRGIRPRSGAPRFMVGPLAHMLKNRFYVGDVVYRGETNKGEHAPIVELGLFEAVQAALKERSVLRRTRRSNSPSFLSGLLHDDRGNRMSPSHASKNGVRYRYYVSQALLQNSKATAGAIARVSAPDVEELVVSALRHRLASERTADNDRELPDCKIPDRDLVRRHVERVQVRARQIEILLRGSADLETVDAADSKDDEAGSNDQANSDENRPAPLVITAPWTSPAVRARKGIAFEPSQQRLDPATRDKLLTAIARARLWMDDLVNARAASFEAIAVREKVGERHIRFLAPLAFLSPRLIAAIADGHAPADLTVTALARALPHSWSEQERRFNIG